MEIDLEPYVYSHIMPMTVRDRSNVTYTESIRSLTKAIWERETPQQRIAYGLHDQTDIDLNQANKAVWAVEKAVPSTYPPPGSDPKEWEEHCWKLTKKEAKRMKLLRGGIIGFFSSKLILEILWVLLKWYLSQNGWFNEQAYKAYNNPPN